MDARWHLKSHLASTSCENFGVLGHARWMWGEIWKVISHTPCVRTLVVEGTLGHTRWIRGEIWKVILHAPHVRTLVVEGILGHTRWTWGEIWKVILCAPRMRTLLLDVTSLMSGGQMRKICRNFPLYTFLMSSHMDVRWDLKGHLVCTSRENFGVVEGTLGHARWMRGEIWKVILHASHMRTLLLVWAT